MRAQAEALASTLEGPEADLLAEPPGGPGPARIVLVIVASAALTWAAAVLAFPPVTRPLPAAPTTAIAAVR